MFFLNAIFYLYILDFKASLMGFNILFYFFMKFFLLLCLFISPAIAKNKYQNDFAIFCKSYKNDLEKSLFMYQSVEKNLKEDYPFFMVVPEKDITIFKNSFNDLKKENKIKKIPEFLTEEYILQKCNILDKIKNGTNRLKSGWSVQQMVKMCIYSTGIAKDYMTVDSDVYFIKDFDKNILYQDGVLKTVGVKIGNGGEKDAMKYLSFENNGQESSHKYQTHGYVKYVFKPQYAQNGKSIDYPWHNFISHYALWSSDIMTEMTKYVYDTMHFDIADLINITPWEMQWYGTFIESKYPDKLYLMPSNFVTTLGYRNEELKYWFCTPTNGYNGSYMIANQGVGKGLYIMPDTKWCKTRNFFRSIFFGNNII